MGWLVVIALIGAILWVFAAVFKRRARANLERIGHELPPELAALRASTAGAGPPVAATRAVPAIPAPGAPPPAHFMLIYDLPADFAARRAPHRDAHLALAWQAAERGELVLAGALEDAAAQAFLLFRGSREAALRFASADPYVQRGLVRSWQVRQWHTVAGAQAATPLRPARAL